MLMFVFGAGASFDSDPEVRPGGSAPVDGDDFRPPLAAGLFAPNNEVGKAAISEFPRAGSLLMRLRQATRRGEDIEEALETIAANADAYPGSAAQLLAFRAYLARLLDIVPSRWVDECQGLTNYVPALEQADRWNKALNPRAQVPVACVTFNYDTILERAVQSVFGYSLDSMESYTDHPDIHVLKPHGSVTWRQSATWNQPANHWMVGSQGLTKAIREAESLDWHGDFRYQTSDDYQDNQDATKVWLPALSIPIRHKATFTMPKAHEETLRSDLGKVTTLIAVGWRARERHFLRLLEDSLSSKPVRLVAVAENDESAQETVDNLWETGRFDQFAISGVGFSGFTESSPEDYRRVPNPPNHTRLTLQDVLTTRSESGCGVWTGRTPTQRFGLRPTEDDPPFGTTIFADL